MAPQANLGADSYAVYIFHPFVIVPLAFVLGGITMLGLLTWLWVAPLALALALSFLLAQGVRKLPVAGGVVAPGSARTWATDDGAVMKGGAPIRIGDSVFAEKVVTRRLDTPF